MRACILVFCLLLVHVCAQTPDNVTETLTTSTALTLETEAATSATVVNATDATTTTVETTTVETTTVAATTSVAVNETSTNGTLHNCLKLPVETLQVPKSKCVVDFRLWRVDCAVNLKLPEENAIATSKSISFEIVRCLPNGTDANVTVPATLLLGRFSLVYELTLPGPVKAAASKITTVPTGDSVFSLMRPINVTDAELTIPVWPSSGLITVDVDGDGKLVSPRSLGIVVVLNNINVNSTHVSAGVKLRICTAKPTCSEVQLVDKLAFGFDDVCCIPQELQCSAERETCKSDSVSRMPLFDGAVRGASLSSMAIALASILFALLKI